MKKKKMWELLVKIHSPLYILLIYVWNKLPSQRVQVHIFCEKHIMINHKN